MFQYLTEGAAEEVKQLVRDEVRRLTPEKTEPKEERPEQPCYSIEQACRVLGVSRPTIYKYIREGVLPVWSMGGRRYIPTDALREKVNAEKRYLS